MLTKDDVQRLARAGRVAPDPSYHANQKSIKFKTLAAALEWCNEVRVDNRKDAAGKPRHPSGYVAWGQTWEPRKYRVDFNLGTDTSGEQMILIVTGMELPS